MTVTTRIPIDALSASRCSSATLGINHRWSFCQGSVDAKNAPLRENSRSGAFVFWWDVAVALCVALLAHQQMVGDHNGFALLVNDVEMLGHDALVCMFLMIFLVADGNHRMNGVADIDRLDEA